MAGYKDPPKEHQFKRGSAPGRPKGVLNMKTRMINALLKKCEYPDLSKPPKKGQPPIMLKGQMADLLIASLLNLAIKGNTTAAQILLDRTEGLVMRADGDDLEGDQVISSIEINIIDPLGLTKDEAD